MATGRATNGKGGDVLVSVGAGTTYTGGDIVMSAGLSTAVKGGTGGAVSVTTGHGHSTSSGAYILQTSDAGTAGVSGALSFTSGTSQRRQLRLDLAVHRRCDARRGRRHSCVGRQVSHGHWRRCVRDCRRQHAVHGRRRVADDGRGHGHDERLVHRAHGECGADGVSGC